MKAEPSAQLGRDGCSNDAGLRCLLTFFPRGDLTLVIGTVRFKSNPGLVCRESEFLACLIGFFILWTFQTLRREYSISKGVNAPPIFTR